MILVRDPVSFRLGVLLGAIGAAETVRLNLAPGEVAMLDAWLEELANWTHGPMPPPPVQWAETEAEEWPSGCADEPASRP